MPLFGGVVLLLGLTQLGLGFVEGRLCDGDPALGSRQLPNRCGDVFACLRGLLGPCCSSRTVVDRLARSSRCWFGRPGCGRLSRRRRSTGGNGSVSLTVGRVRHAREGSEAELLFGQIPQRCVDPSIREIGVSRELIDDVADLPASRLRAGDRSGQRGNSAVDQRFQCDPSISGRCRQRGCPRSAGLNLRQLGRRCHQGTDGLAIVAGRQHRPQRQVGALERLQERRPWPVALGSRQLDQTGPLTDVVIRWLAEQHAGITGIGRHAGRLRHAWKTRERRSPPGPRRDVT